jgi:hypothetical protein
MTWYLRNSETSSSNTVDHLIYQLAGDPRDEHIRVAHAAVSADQCSAIVAFLEFIKPRLERLSEDYLVEFVNRGIAYWSRAAV